MSSFPDYIAYIIEYHAFENAIFETTWMWYYAHA